MFGSVRPAASSPDSLERPPSKIFKDNSLSVYENTLVKLKLGSKLQIHSGSDLSKADDDALEDSFQSQLPSSNRNVSVISMFSKYRRRSRNPATPCNHKDDDLSSTTKPSSPCK